MVTTYDGTSKKGYGRANNRGARWKRDKEKERRGRRGNA